MLEQIEKSNQNFFEVLAQDYEEEFSSITGKQKNQNGKYQIDVDWMYPNIGYLWKEGQTFAGFCILNHVDEYLDVGEFYVDPSYRRLGIGTKMAFELFSTHRGCWQVRQLLKATLAQNFWRKVIFSYTNGHYEEVRIDDPKWGEVICQRFSSSS